MANAMAESDDSIVLLLPENLDPKLEALVSNKVKLLKFNYIDFFSFRQIYKTNKSIYHQIKSEAPDIIHIQSNGYRWFTILFFLLRKYPIINTIHDPKPHLGDKTQPKDKTLKRFSKKFTSKYIVHGEYLRHILQEAYNIPLTKIATVPHGHLGIYKAFNTKSIPEEKNTLLFFGRIWEYKGLDWLIIAVNELNEEGYTIKLIIAGKGEDFAKYEALIKHPKNFEIHNYRISDEDVSVFFQRACCIVLPYKEATQSGVIPIAYAFNKPVVATKVGSIGEVVNNDSGILVEPNIKSIKEGILDVLSRKNNNAALFKIEEMCSNELSWHKIAELNKNIYSEFL